jgi:hypothetical protein
VQKDFCNKICQQQTRAMQHKTCLLDGLGGFHHSREPDREGRAATRRALDRDVAAHHLTKPFADREPKAGPPYLRVVDASACENSWNSLPICSTVMPMPVSATAMMT